MKACEYMDKGYLVWSRLDQVRGTGDADDHMSLDTWEWPQGVAIFALMKFYESVEDRSLGADVYNWYTHRLEKGIPPRNINTTAPMLALTVLFPYVKKKVFCALIDSWAQWLMDELPRTEEGGFQHVTTHDENRQQLWDDTLYMAVMFLYRAGMLLHRPEWMEEAKYQFLLHIKYLHDQKTGLWYHGYTFEGRHHFGGALWCRGNGWFTAGAVDMLEWMEKDCAREMIARTWQEQCAALQKLQDEETGLWHTLLDDPTSYLETSGSAAIAYGLLKGIRLGLLDGGQYRQTAQKALDGVVARIGEDGTVGGVSYGTPMGRDLDFYRHVPVEPTAYGQGLACMMLAEACYLN